MVALVLTGTTSWSDAPTIDPSSDNTTIMGRHKACPYKVIVLCSLLFLCLSIGLPIRNSRFEIHNSRLLLTALRGFQFEIRNSTFAIVFPPPLSFSAATQNPYSAGSNSARFSKLKKSSGNSSSGCLRSRKVIVVELPFTQSLLIS